MSKKTTVVYAKDDMSTDEGFRWTKGEMYYLIEDMNSFTLTADNGALHYVASVKEKVLEGFYLPLKHSKFTEMLLEKYVEPLSLVFGVKILLEDLVYSHPQSGEGGYSIRVHNERTNYTAMRILSPEQMRHFKMGEENILSEALMSTVSDALSSDKFAMRIFLKKGEKIKNEHREKNNGNESQG